MTRREMVARHAGSVGGIGWAYAQPLLLIAAYYLVFDVVFAMRLGPGAPTRAVGAYLVVGALPWTAFCDGLTRTMNSLVESGDVLRKNPLPLSIFPLRSTAASGLIYVPLFGVLILAYAPMHGFQLPIVSLPALLGMQLLMVAVLGYCLAIMTAAVRDVAQIVAFALSVGIFVSPVLFPIDLFPAAWRWVLWVNPMTALVQGYQAVLLQGAWPAGSVWLATALWLLGGSIFLAVALHRTRDQLVDWL